MSSAMPINMDMHDSLDFSGYSTTTNTPSSDDYSAPSNWNHWSPLVNWDAFPPPHDDFHHLIDSIVIDHHHSTLPLTPPPSTSQSNDDDDTTTTTITTTTIQDDPPLQPSPKPDADDTMGLRLVHLLMAAAEALTGPTKSRELARVILLRLKDLVPLTTTTTTSNMERLAAHFTHALHSLLEGTSPAHNNNKRTTTSGSHHVDQKETLTAFQLLQDMSPYVKFGHFTANQAIVEAVTHHRRAHIVDYDIMEGTQWASLIQALASLKTGPHLRITALSRTGSGSGSGRRSVASVQETGRRLTAFAHSLGQPFSFHQCRLDPDETFRPDSLKLVRGEALVFNCMLNLPHQNNRSTDSVRSFFIGAKTLKPTLVTLVEEEVGPIPRDVGFVGRFMDTLHHYSAFYDSLEAGFPLQGRARALVETVFLGPRIAGSLARIYRTCGEGSEERGSWGEWLSEAGYRGVPVSFANHLQAKLLLSLFNGGYNVEESAANKLILGWRSRRLLSASVWTYSSSSDLPN